MKLSNNIRNNLTQYFLFEKENRYNHLALGIVSILGHIFFGIYWTYVDPQPYENWILRGIGILISLVLISTAYWKGKFRKFIYFYWIFAIIYNLPFFFTTTLILNNFSDIWFVAEATMIFVAVMFAGLLRSICVILLGIIAAIVFCFLIDPTSIYFNQQITKHLPIYFLTFIASFVFGLSNNKGLLIAQEAKNLQDKLEVAKSFAGSIAHELRNPLNAINLIGSQISDLATNLENQKEESKSKLLGLTSHISDSISNANNIINIILGDLSEKKIAPEDFTYLQPDKILPDIIEKFGYKNDEEKSKVKLLLLKNEDDSFLFKAVPERLTYIIFNLLKNALYYLKQYPESLVTIGVETRKINGAQHNVIYVHDTGPGIPSHIIPRLFDDFYTLGKKEGTGLGLAFCKRNMRMFGGDIICESEFGQESNGQKNNSWTKFSLLFPLLLDEEITQATTTNQKKKILLVDDQEEVLLTTKSRLEKIILDVSCDIARSGKEAINMAKQNKYQLILMDVQMPDMNGIETARRIRSCNKEVPIIAFTSLSKDIFLTMLNEEISSSDFNYYLSKMSDNKLLCRNISKWITNLDDDLAYVGTKDDYLKILKGKKAILADDQQLNLLMTKRSLESAGLLVTTANDGKELLNLYKNSLDEKGKSAFDVIITDINMPPHNGDDAAKEIRAIEAAHKISHHDEMPIIALSGDGEKEDIHHFFKCQMTDYFIKGNKPELLLRMVANYLG